jgi:hypothetical protein
MEVTWGKFIASKLTTPFQACTARWAVLGEEHGYCLNIILLLNLF